MPIEITKFTTHQVVAATKQDLAAGGIRVEARLVGDEKLDDVILSIFSVDATQRIEVKAADIERAAQLLEKLRMELGDFRSTCAEHGYYRGRCEACVAPAAVAPPEIAPVSPAAARAFREAEAIANEKLAGPF